MYASASIIAEYRYGYQPVATSGMWHGNSFVNTRFLVAYAPKSPKPVRNPNGYRSRQRKHRESQQGA
jgi:hypothetical protein